MLSCSWHAPISAYCEQTLARSYGIFKGLLEEAELAGGNAVVNVRVVSGTYTKAPDFLTTYVVAYGDAVRLE